MGHARWQLLNYESHITLARIGWNITTGIILALFVLSVVSACSTSTPSTRSNSSGLTIQSHATQPAISSSSAATSPSKAYISIAGQNFVYNNNAVHPYGATMYPHWNYHGALHRGGGWTYTAFRSYIDQIINMAQQAHLNTLRPTNFFDGTTYGDWYNATVWSNMDYLFKEAASHGMYVILDLSSFRDKTLKQGIYPYDPSLYTSAFSWVASRYAENSALLNYAIAGEVACPTGSDPLRPTSTQALTYFYRILSDTLHAADPNHLISSGGLSHLNQADCGIDWKSIFSLPHINIAAIHVYSDHDRIITMPMVSTWAKENSKPFAVEEFGFQQGQDDAQRAAAFQNMYTLGKQFGATAIVFWNLGPEVASTSYEVNPNTPLTWNTIVRNAPQ
jgi:Cellulase (glycosyl hydrolase family 5)